MKRTIVVLAAAFLLLAGCSVKQEIALAGDGSGGAVLNVELAPMLVNYLQDLSGSVTQDGSFSIFDTKTLSQTLEKEPGVTVRTAESKNSGTLHLELTFTDISRVLAAQGESVDSFLRFSRSGERKTLVITVSQQVVKQLFSLTPLSGSMVEQTLLPPPESKMGKKEYIDYLSWAMEEYAPDGDAASIIGNAVIHVGVTVKGSILSQSGGVQDGNRVDFQLPVVDLLTARSPITYQITFR